MNDIVTPIKVNELNKLLMKSGFEDKKCQYLVEGFSKGFDLGYRGPTVRWDVSDNLPFKIGTPKILWNKVMKEVKECHYAGPFEDIPYDNFMQLPIGLVPKAGNKTRLIFHLSYDFGKDNETEKKSFNYHTPKEMCSVKYNDIDHAVVRCLKMIE